MITLERAREIADEYIDSLNKDSYQNIEMAVMHHAVRALEDGWLFNFNSLEYVQTKENSLIGGTFPFIVDKENGALHLPGDKGKLSIFLKGEMNRKWF